MFITNSLNKSWISAYFFLPFTCCGIIFLYLKWPAYTWTTQQRKHPAKLSLCILLTCWEYKSQHFHSCMIFGFKRGVNEICAFWGDFAQRRLIVSCRRFGTTVGGGEILTAVLVKIQVIWDVSPCRLVNLPASSGPTAQDVTFFIPSSHPRFYSSRSLSLLWLHGILSQRREKVCTIFICLFFWGSLQCFWCTWKCYECSNCTTFHRNVRHPSPVNTCVRTSCLKLGHRAGPSYCVTSLLQMWRLSPHSQKPHNGHIFHSVHYDILTLNQPTTTIVAQPFNVIKWQLKFNPVA